MSSCPCSASDRVLPVVSLQFAFIALEGRPQLQPLEVYTVTSIVRIADGAHVTHAHICEHYKFAVTRTHAPALRAVKLDHAQLHRAIFGQPTASGTVAAVQTTLYQVNDAILRHAVTGTPQRPPPVETTEATPTKRVPDVGNQSPRTPASAPLPMLLPPVPHRLGRRLRSFSFSSSDGEEPRNDDPNARWDALLAAITPVAEPPWALIAAADDTHMDVDDACFFGPPDMPAAASDAESVELHPVTRAAREMALMSRAALMLTPIRE